MKHLKPSAIVLLSFGLISGLWQFILTFALAFWGFFGSFFIGMFTGNMESLLASSRLFMFSSIGLLALIVLAFATGLRNALSSERSQALSIVNLVSILCILAISAYDFTKLLNVILFGVKPSAQLELILLVLAYFFLPGLQMLLAWVLSYLRKKGESR